MAMEGEDDWTANPFADPSVAQATAPATAVIIPTESTSTKTPTTPVFAADTALSTVPAMGSGPTTASTVSASTQEQRLAEREAKLDEREETLRAQQAALEEREREVERIQANKGNMPPNWPPFPDWMPSPFKPWLYHSIEHDIMRENQASMTRMYRLWQFLCVCYVANFIAALAGALCTSCTMSANVGAALAFMCLGIPASFQLWYRTLYKGMKKDRAISFMLFFFIFGFQILVDFWFTIGPPGHAAGGWLAAFRTLSYSWFAGFFYIVSAICWSACTAFCIYMIIQIHAYYKGTDYTLDRAQGELYSDAASNGMGRRLLQNAFS